MRSSIIIRKIDEAFGFSIRSFSPNEQKRIIAHINVLLDYAEGGTYKKYDWGGILQAFHALGQLTGNPPTEETGVRGWLGKKGQSLKSFLGKFVVDNEPYVIRRSFMSYTKGENVHSFARRLEEINKNKPGEPNEPPCALMMLGHYTSYDMESLLKWSGKHWTELDKIAKEVKVPLLPSISKKKTNKKSMLTQWGKEERELLMVPSDKELTMSDNGHPQYPVLLILGPFLPRTTDAAKLISKEGTKLTANSYGVSLSTAKKVYKLL